MARRAARGRLLRHVRVRARPRRQRRQDGRGQRGLALRAKRQPRPAVAARGPGGPPHGRRRRLPPGERPRRIHGRVGDGIRLLPGLRGRRPIPRARRRHRALPDLLGRAAPGAVCTFIQCNRLQGLSSLKRGASVCADAPLDTQFGQ